MTSAALSPETRVVRRAGSSTTEVAVDLCVVGAGISGISAAIEAARLGRDVLLVDGLPALGGQTVNSIIGTFCGLFANGAHGAQLTHGVADEILRDLGAQGALRYRSAKATTIVLYDEVALGRWVEKAVAAAGVKLLLGAVLRNIRADGTRIRTLDCATRYGDVAVTAKGFVDVSGDAALASLAGLACREPEVPHYGSQMLVLEGVDETHYPAREAILARLAETAEQYGLARRDGFAFPFVGRGIALINMNHVTTPLDPLQTSTKGIEGKEQADRSFRFLRSEIPESFGAARVRAYGLAGILGARHGSVHCNGCRCCARARPRRRWQRSPDRHGRAPSPRRRQSRAQGVAAAHSAQIRGYHSSVLDRIPDDLGHPRLKLSYNIGRLLLRLTQPQQICSMRAYSYGYHAAPIRIVAQIVQDLARNDQ